MNLWIVSIILFKYGFTLVVADFCFKVVIIAYKSESRTGMPVFRSLEGNFPMLTNNYNSKVFIMTYLV